MATSVVMPALEMVQETGRLVAWHKKEGDPVAKGDLLMSVETDKAVIDIEADAGGVLAGVTANVDDVVAVGQVIAWILAPGELLPAQAQAHVSGRTGAAPAGAAPAAVAAQPQATAEAERPLLSPKARRLAAERGLDTRAIAGSGPDGAVTAADIAASAAAAPDAPSTVWRIMAERVTSSWTTVPHFFLTRDVDATALVEARRQVNAQSGAAARETVTVTDQLVAVVARVLRKHARVNASWVEGAVRRHAEVNVGIATAVEDGLVVPVIHRADTLGLRDIARRRRELIDRAKAGRLQPDEIARGTVTISNLGMYGIDAFNAIVNAPQAVILAVGRIADRVVARDGRPVVCPQMTVTLSCDHRVVDGARGAEFLRDVVQALEHPSALVDVGA
jgi:pyruvate dehydrogenase E2 component (dihydrolipoamide acetyltransferase)